MIDGVMRDLLAKPDTGRHEWAAKDPWVFAIQQPEGVSLQDGTYGSFLVTYSARLTGVYLDEQREIDGDVEIDIEMRSAAGGVWASIIGGGTKPTLSSSHSYDSDDLSDWTTTKIDADATPVWFRVIVSSADTIEGVAVGLRVKSLERVR